MMYIQLKKGFLQERFRKRVCVALDFLRSVDYDTIKDGKNILEDGIFYFAQRYLTRPPESALFEVHKKYADIQYIVSGQEQILGTNNILEEKEPFNETNDIGFFSNDKADSSIVLSPGEFALYMPGEYHMPSLHPDGKTPTEVEKIVVKIPID